MAYRRNSRFRLKPLAAALAGMALAPQAALAQTSPQPETTLPEVKVRDSADNDYSQGVTTIGRVPTPIRDIPQSVTVINRAVMEAQGAASIGDVLRNVPGITLTAAEGGTIGNNINLRGFSARTDLYLDGVRDRGQYYRDIFSLDAIEVLKGPSSMLFGRGSTGGAINQVSKVPSLTPHSEISVMAGTQPSLRLTADVDRPTSDTSAFRISIMAQDVDSTRDVMRNRDYGIAPSMRFGIGTPTEITLSALALHNHDMPDYGLPPLNGRPAPVDRHNFYGVTDDRTIQDVGELSLRIKHKITPAMILRNQTQFIAYGIDVRESGPNNVGTINGLGQYQILQNGNTNGNLTVIPPEQLLVGLGSHDRVIYDRSAYNQTDLISDFATGPVKHTLLTGLELGRDYYRNQAYTRTDPTLQLAPGTPVVFSVVSLTDPAQSATASNAATATGNLVKGTATTIAPYVNDTMALSEQWKLVAGVRYDRYDAELTNSINAPPSGSQVVHYTSVRGGLIYQPDLVQSYYASYGTSFNPSLEALTLTNGQQNVPPEENRSYEVGGKWDFMNGNLSLTSALFQIDKFNARSQVSPGVFDLTGNVRVRGGEVGAAGRITSRWQVLAGLTYLDAEIVSASPLDGTQGKIPANTPTLSSSLWTAYNVTREWELGGGFTTMSSRYANNTDTVSVGTFVRVDATVAYHQPKYDLRLNVFNLTNRLNYDQVIQSDGGRSVPGIDRTAIVSVNYRF